MINATAKEPEEYSESQLQSSPPKKNSNTSQKTFAGYFPFIIYNNEVITYLGEVHGICCLTCNVLITLIERVKYLIIIIYTRRKVYCFKKDNIHLRLVRKRPETF